MSRASRIVVPLFALVVAACSSGSPGAATPTGGASQASSNASSPASTPRASSATGGTKPTVDIVLSGAATVTAKGSAGTCMLGKDASGTVTAFGFSATESDYPGLGVGLFIDEAVGGSVTMKWLQSASVGYLNTGEGVTVAPDHKSITLDADFGGSTVHIAGTIACP